MATPQHPLFAVDSAVAWSYLAAILRYHPKEGVFTWRVNRTCTRARNEAGNIHAPTGRHRIKIDGVIFFRSRLAWLYMTGKWPDAQVDHIDGDCANDKWANLRDVDARTNKENTVRPHSRNSSGFLGVTKMKRGYGAAICVNYKQIRLGTFDSPEEAQAAYVAAKRKLHNGNTL